MLSACNHATAAYDLDSDVMSKFAIVFAIGILCNLMRIAPDTNGVAARGRADRRRRRRRMTRHHKPQLTEVGPGRELVPEITECWVVV
mmetsp:Transcript_5370/g.13860  ORF Transcript_5370/g.13860 Transcript_5370/m.13860 type:complete len:88 (+) Transcript_5370:209-472(+)